MNKMHHDAPIVQNHFENDKDTIKTEMKKQKALKR